jgi:hypothetical protein
VVVIAARMNGPTPARMAVSLPGFRRSTLSGGSTKPGQAH